MSLSPATALYMCGTMIISTLRTLYLQSKKYDFESRFTTDTYIYAHRPISKTVNDPYKTQVDGCFCIQFTESTNRCVLTPILLNVSFFILKSQLLGMK